MTEIEIKNNSNKDIQSFIIRIGTIFFLIVIGFILSLEGFWNLESILWNRIKYSTGSSWKNAYPIYFDYSINEILELFSFALNEFLSGLVIFSTSALVLIIYLQKKKLKTKYNAILIVITSFLIVINLIMNIWLKLSLEIISTFPSVDSDTTGTEWINQNLNPFSSNLLNLTNVMIYIFSILILTLIIFIIANLKKDKNSNKNNNEFVRSANIFTKVIRNQDKSEIAINRKKSINISKLFSNIAFYFILLLYLIFTLFPIFLTLKVSISSAAEIDFGYNPADPLRNGIINYSSVIFATSVDEPNFLNALRNSLFIGLGTGFLGLAVSVTSAYALARFKFKGNNLLTFLILSTQMFPAIILLIPQYVIWTSLGLLERNIVVFGVLLASAAGATAYCTWMMKGYFETIPIDIEEAARIDGAGKFATFIKIALPLAKSGLVAVLVFTFLTSWQEFVLARTFIGESDIRATLPLLFYQYQNPAAPDTPTFYELLTPYAVLVALPVVIFFMLIQKQLASGAVAGGVK